LPVSTQDAFWFLAAGIFNGTAHFCIIDALRTGEASALAPVRYTALLWAALLGFLIWGEVPELWLLAGAAVIVGSSWSDTLQFRPYFPEGGAGGRGAGKGVIRERCGRRPRPRRSVRSFSMKIITQYIVTIISSHRLRVFISRSLCAQPRSAQAPQGNAPPSPASIARLLPPAL
jgi:hypothetical protein